MAKKQQTETKTVPDLAREIALLQLSAKINPGKDSNARKKLLKQIARLKTE